MRKVIGAVTGATLPLFFAASAFAVDPTPTPTNVNPCANTTPPFKALCELGSANLGNVVGSVVNFVFVIAVIMALFFLIFGGVKWVMSGGDKTAVETARNHIVAALVGLIVIFLAYFIVNILLGFFLGQGISQLTLPTLNQPTPTP